MITQRPAETKLSLYPFQNEGVGFLRKTGRCILADDMGLGKTAQALAAAEAQRCRHVLIICPKTVKRVWDREITKWLGAETTRVIVKGRTVWRTALFLKGARFTIGNYEHLRLHERVLLDVPWDLIIIDEAHKLKNRDAKSTKSAWLVTRRWWGIPLWELTGTPMLNRPDELFSLLHMISPASFGSYWAFVKEWFRYEAKYGVVGGAWKEVGVKKVTGVNDPVAFREMLGKYMLRRLKEDVLDLPPKVYEDIEVELEGEQLRSYETMRDEMYASLADTLGNDKEINATAIIAQITRLKQISVSHLLLNPYTNKIEGAKIDALKDILEDSAEQKVVVFSQFAEALRRIKPVLQDEGHRVVTLLGSDSDYTREQNIKNFQEDPTVKCMLVSIGAGGLGVTLTAARIGVFLDLAWTPAANQQAADRLHRIGQKGTVTIYNLVAQETLEDWIIEKLKYKQELFEETIPVQRITDYLISEMRKEVTNRKWM